jgi:hypothetical protein
MPSRRRLSLIAIVPAAASALLLVGGCSAASYDQKIDYLHTVAERGAQMHTTLVNEQEKPTQPRCTAAYTALIGTDKVTIPNGGSGLEAHAPEDAPNDVDVADGGPGVSPDYAGQISDFYITSCVTGVPKPTPGQPSASTPAAPTTAPATSMSAGAVAAH